MTFHVFLFLLSVCLLISLALLWRLGWLHLQPSHSAVASRRSPIHRLLKPRTPLDCPSCCLGSTPSSAGGSVPTPVRPWPEVKSRRGAPKRIDTEGFACPNPRCPYFGITDAHIHALVGDGRHGREDPDLSLSGLPHHLHFQAPYSPLSSENSLTPDRHGALGAC